MLQLNHGPVHTLILFANGSTKDLNSVFPVFFKRTTSAQPERIRFDWLNLGQAAFA